MGQYFQDCLAIGKTWELTMESWMRNYLKDTGWEIHDSSHVYRDEDGDQFPDYTLIHIARDKYCFIDAKKRNTYKHYGHEVSFGFDATLYKSYTNIARKHDTKVYVGFHDPKFDPKHVYLLDLAQPENFVYNYGNNGHGQPLCYRWYVSSLTKFEL